MVETNKEDLASVEKIEEDPATFERIIAKFKEMNIDFKLTTHEPVLTSQEAADIRGVSL